MIPVLAKCDWDQPIPPEDRSDTPVAELRKRFRGVCVWHEGAGRVWWLAVLIEF